MKLENLQPEHLLVLKAFYNITENDEMKVFTDVPLTTILSKVDLPPHIVDVCYKDLARELSL